jgi:hypothetical protein
MLMRDMAVSVERMRINEKSVTPSKLVWHANTQNPHPFVAIFMDPSHATHRLGQITG